MTRPPAPQPLSPVERDVLHALAWEMLPMAPGLDAQVHDLRVSRRSDSRSGYFAQFITPSTRSFRNKGPSGLHGTVHAMIEGLPQAVGFQLHMRNGSVVGLVADAYGQQVGSAELGGAKVQQLFYLDTEGVSRSVPARQQPAPVRARREAPPTPHVASTIIAAAQRMNGVPENLRQVIAEATPAMTNAFEAPAPSNTGGLRIGIWAAMAALAGVLIAVGVPWFFAVGIAFFVGRNLTSRKVLGQLVPAAQRWGDTNP